MIGFRYWFLAIMLASLAPAVAVPSRGTIAIGDKLLDLTMHGLSGPSRRISEYRGKPLLINVWASWCGPCRNEMSSLIRLARRHGGRQFNIIGVSTDDSMEAAYVFLEKAAVPFENFIDRKLVLEDMLGANRIPLTLLVDAEGRLLERHYGARDWDSPEARQIIAKAFKIRL